MVALVVLGLQIKALTELYQAQVDILHQAAAGLAL
jgi:hypothetical protein